MSIALIKAGSEAEARDELHLCRLLILLGNADARKTSTTTKRKAVEGITKLAKLDFLLRYPTYLERALIANNKKVDALKIEGRERTSIEAKMIRFRYGPWDPRYRRWLGLLSARNLVTLGVEGRTIQIGLTDSGRSLSATLATNPAFADLSKRSAIVTKAFGSLTATKIKDLVYEIFPELLDMRWGEEILTQSIDWGHGGATPVIEN